MKGSFDLFIICAVAEVLIIWCFYRKPDCPAKRHYPNGSNPLNLPRTEPLANGKFLPTPAESPAVPPAKLPAEAVSYVSIFARLMILYILCCMTISVLGGLIDFFYYGLLMNEKQYFSAEDYFKIMLLRNDIHLLVVDILSRIPVNLVDRFIVVFGGFLISRLIYKKIIIFR